MFLEDFWSIGWLSRVSRQRTVLLRFRQSIRGRMRAHFLDSLNL
jgi:hypothetical protein